MASKKVVAFGYSHLLQGSISRAFAEGLSGADDPDARQALRQARAAYDANDLNVALRVMDRAWRYCADEAPNIAPIYGRLLFLEAREYAAALSMLKHSVTSAPDPDAAALSALSLLNLQRPEEARGQLEAALGEYGVSPDSLLAYAAGEVAGHAAIAAPGWVARGPDDLRVLGEVWAGAVNGGLDIKAGSDAAFTHLLRAERDATPCAFALQLPQAAAGVRLQVRIGGKPLVGSGQAIPLDFGLDGRASSNGRTVSGWARIGWAPDAAVTLRLEDSAHKTAQIDARHALSARRWAFSQSARSLGLVGERITVTARLPDGGWQALPDSPVLLEPAVRLTKTRPPPLPRWGLGAPRPRKRPAQRARGVDVVIPVFRGLEESLASIDSAVATVTRAAAVVVVDDATQDTALAAALDARAKSRRIVLLRNKVNLGFVGSINRALALHKARDVVLLNSDTLVFGDWLERLREAAYSRSSIGTVTPFSNNASIASYPQPLGGAIDPRRAAELDVLAAATHAGVGADIPVGVGSCLYLRRDCLRDVGTFDVEIFGKGYGEETDFCLRARQRGWTHRLAADVYVYHAGGSSFGTRRAALLDRSQRLLNLRHPGYDRFIGSFITQDPLHRLRRQLDERRLIGLAGPFVLLVTLSLPGGVDRYVAERSMQLRKWGLQPLVLRPAAVGNAKCCELWSEALTLPNLQYDVPGELAELVGLLGTIGLKGIEIQHFLGLDPRVIEAIRGLSVPYDVMVHDYAWVCPRVTLIDGSGRYCGEPVVAVCEACVKQHGSSLEEKITVRSLRARSTQWLQGARRVLAPSADTAARLRRHFSDLTVVVQPHTLPYSTVPKLTEPLPGRRLRVALLGAVGHHKGYGVLLECARDARARKLPIEFVVIGFTLNDAPLLATGHVFVTGRYEEDEVPHLLDRERPDMGWLPSVWPETWCYTLDHLLKTGLPMVSFDIGALAERLRSIAGAVLLPLNLAPARINDRLLQLARQLQVPEKIF
jgi:GT2 family glycosyltransferase/tetratricopeptide (TPR) repeat protein